MLKVVYYARVSTEEEKQINALKIQVEEAEGYIATQHNWLLVDSYIDEGISGTTVNKRDEFKRLITDLYTNKFDIIVVKNEERIGRNAYEAGLFLSPLINNNKKLYYYLDQKYFNPEEELLNMVKYGMAAQFSRDLSKKMNNAQKKRMEKGRVITNGRMWGYDQKDGQLFINEKEAEVVRFVFEQYADGFGFRVIKNKLDEKGITNLNGNTFALTTLKRIIKNEKYKGVLVMGKKHKDYNTKKTTDVPESEWVIHNDKIPSIVSTELWEEANRKLEGKRKEYGLEEKRKIAGYFSGTHLYSGKIKCSVCGRPFYHSVYTTGKNKDIKTAIWECKGYREFGKKVDKGGCDNTRVHQNEMDDIVKHVVFDFWKNKDENVQSVINILEGILSENQYKTTIDKLVKEKDKLEKKKDKLIELYSEELITKEDFRTRNEDYTAQLVKAQNDIQELESKNKATVAKRERLLKIKSFFQTKLESKDSLNDEIINNFLNGIVVYPNHRIKITLNGNFEFMASKENDEVIFLNVTGTRPNGYTN
jgi:site-specific DNA recombinase